jgi:hypothetical protein
MKEVKRSKCLELFILPLKFQVFDTICFPSFEEKHQCIRDLFFKIRFSEQRIKQAGVMSIWYAGLLKCAGKKVRRIGAFLRQCLNSKINYTTNFV